MGSILITGVIGGLAQIVAKRLLDMGKDVVGVDYRLKPDSLDNRIKFYRANYSKTRIEDIFKYHEFESVLHLGRVSVFSEANRFDLNVVGSQKIMNLCATYNIKRLVVLSTFHVYGAHPENHTPISEDDPLRAGLKFPQIADAIQLDNMASTWIYKHPEVVTSVLRPTSIVGPNIQNTMSTLLRRPRINYILGYDPMLQFIHEEDLADAIVCAYEKPIRGVFNIAGNTSIPWKKAISLSKGIVYALPGPVASVYWKLTSGVPLYMVNFFKYPCIVSDKEFKSSFNWDAKINIEDTIWSTVSSARERHWAEESARKSSH